MGNAPSPVRIVDQKLESQFSELFNQHNIGVSTRRKNGSGRKKRL